VTWRERRNIWSYIALVLPGLLVYIWIIAYPVIYSIGLSFTDFNPNAQGRASFVGLRHYIRMFQDSWFWHALKNNMIVVGVSVFGQIPIGFVLAYILFRRLVRAPHFFQALVFLPHFLSVIVIGTMWKRIFQADGPASGLIQLISGDPSAQFTLMLSAKTVMVPVGFALIWVYTGLYMIIFLANLQKIDTDLLEAATIDGANEPTIFFRVIVPLLAGTVLVCAVLAIAGSLRGFDLIFSITTMGLQRNNAMVLPIYMYQTAFQDYRNPERFAYGATISNAIVLISVVMILIANQIGRGFQAED
jgi:raffinose/stachyose/melibiose transport system permease protein